MTGLACFVIGAAFGGLLVWLYLAVRVETRF